MVANIVPCPDLYNKLYKLELASVEGLNPKILYEDSLQNYVEGLSSNTILLPTYADEKG